MAIGQQFTLKNPGAGRVTAYPDGTRKWGYVRVGDNPTVICDLPGTFPWIRIPPELKLLRRADYFNDFDERMMA
jgi:hypothetical protein